MAKIKFLFILFVCLSFVACYEEGEIFIPTNAVGPFEELNEITNNKSSAHKLNNQGTYSLKTEYNTIIEIENGLFFQQTEDTDIDYEFFVVEMKSYLDFILQNVDHRSELGLTNTIYSFYYSAENNGKSLTVDESKFLKVKIPSERIDGELFMGKGTVNTDGELSWKYYDNSLNSRIRYTNWEEIDEYGGITKIEGYELLVDNPGWYSIVAKMPRTVQERSICLNLNTNYNPENTLAYIILNSENYLSKFRIGSDGNAFCISDVPVPTDIDEVTLVTVSYLNDKSYHLHKEEIPLSALQSEYDIIPLPVSRTELIDKLEAL